MTKGYHRIAQYVQTHGMVCNTNVSLTSHFRATIVQYAYYKDLQCPRHTSNKVQKLIELAIASRSTIIQAYLIHTSKKYKTSMHVSYFLKVST